MNGIEIQPIPWQRRKELGLIKAFLQTAKQVLFKPGDFFNNLEIKESYSEPFDFWIINFIFMFVVTIIYNIFFEKGGDILLLLISLVLSPLLIFSLAAFMHLVILLFRGKGGFKGTFNVLAYSSAAGIFYVIPFIGTIIGAVLGIILWGIGFKRIHKFGTPRVILVCFFNPQILLIISLLASIAVPNLARARLIANNHNTATETLRAMSVAIKSYAVANEGRYPIDEGEFVFPDNHYLSVPHHNRAVNGYNYTLKLSSDNYEITAEPEKCGVTGYMIFKTGENQGISTVECK